MMISVLRHGLLPAPRTDRDLEAVQVFWPDKNGKFPFDVGCDLDVYQRQPRLDLPLPPSEVREFRRRWE
jgi:hypothetical protein